MWFSSFLPVFFSPHCDYGYDNTLNIPSSVMFVIYNAIYSVPMLANDSFVAFDPLAKSYPYRVYLSSSVADVKPPSLSADYYR